MHSKKKSTYANYKYIISNEFNTKRLSSVTISRGIIQTGVEYLNLFLFDTHFTSIAQRYQLKLPIQSAFSSSFPSYFLYTHARRLWSAYKKKWISFNLEWGFLVIFIIHTASDESTQFRCVEQPSLIMQKLTLPSLPLRIYRELRLNLETLK